MQYNLRIEKMTLTDIERDDLDKKMERIEKHLHPPFTADVAFEHDRHHLKGDVITCKIIIKQGKQVFHASRVSDTIADALDEVLHALKRELEKDHDRRKEHHV